MRGALLSLSLLAVVIGGCVEVNNYYDCEVVDGGGCGMSRGDYAQDHDGTDELLEDTSSPASTSIFTADSKIQDSIGLTEGAAPVTLVEARCKDGAPHLISVNLATPIGEFPIQPGGPPPPPAESYAVIEFGVGGTAYQMEVDYGVGVQFAMVASRIKITAVFAKVPSDVVVASSGTRLQLGASVGQGTVAPTQAPTRTLSYHWFGGGAGLAPGATRFFTAPMFAKSVIVTAFAAVPGAPVVILQVTDMYNNVNYAVPLAAFPSVPIPLANNIRSIYVYNNGATAIYNLQLIYQLAA